MIKMLVTCGECGGEISRYAVVCPHCGYGSGYGHAGENSLESQEEDRKFWARIEEEKEIKAQQLAAEEKRRRKREEKEEAIKKRRRDDFVMAIVMIIIVFALAIGLAMGARYFHFEIVQPFISKWF